MEDWRNAGFGLYLHWPFCASKCPYCDFNSHVAATIDEARWKAAYLHEIRRAAEEFPRRVLNTVFFGGGTPSLMSPELVAAIMEAVGEGWTLANDLEVTLEANPGSVEAGRFQGYADAGVNRVSMGIQALNDADLKRLGRLHSAAEARAAFGIARDIFDRVSFDLIYARQGQALAAWEAELREAATMAVDHLSVYQLTIEDGTAFGARQAAGGMRDLPGDDLAADMYMRTNDILEELGLAAYEVSNHAREGSESRHNLIYWRQGDYIGIGPGAHGRVTLAGARLATEAPKDPQRWLRQVEREGRGELNRTPIAPNDQAGEYLMMAIRLSEGMDIGRYDALSGTALSGETMARLTELGMVNRSGSRLVATREGRMVLNALIRELLP